MNAMGRIALLRITREIRYQKSFFRPLAAESLSLTAYSKESRGQGQEKKWLKRALLINER